MGINRAHAHEKERLLDDGLFITEQAARM
jgi:hypothetical protein